MKIRSLVSFAAIWLLALAVSPALHAAIQASYYVAPTGSGSDSNNGTSPSTPFATLTKARDVVRTVNSSMTGDIMIYLLPGDHLVPTALELTPVDSGTNGHYVVWTSYGAKGSARLIGGTKVTNWSSDGANIMKAPVTITGPRLQAIYENGERSRVARHPNSGYWSIAAKDATTPKKKFQWNSANSLPVVATTTDLQVFVWPGNLDWSTEIRDVASVAYASRWITLTMNIQQPYLGQLSPGSRFFVQGGKELLDQAGEFYHDAANNMLYYWPRSTPITSQEIIVPNTGTIFNAVATGATNLQARWKFENNVEDSSAAENHGEAINTPTYVTGPTGLGNAISLNGTNQSVSVAHSSTLTFGAPSAGFTVMAWIKTSTTGVLQPAVSKARPETNGVDIDYRLGLDAAGKAQLNRFNADNGGGTEAMTDSDGAALNNGAWHHLAFVNEGNASHKLYVDGALVETSTTTWNYNNSNPDPLEIGKYSNAQGGIFNHFTGQIDDVRIYQSALSATGVADVYNGTDSDLSLQNITFMNLRFAATGLDSNNYTGVRQGMIYGEKASNLVVLNNEFENIGGSAVNIAGPGSGISVIGNHMTDAGIAGVTLRTVSNSIVSNNRIHNTAQIFANAGSNITLSDTTDSEVSYNQVSESKRQGISLRNASYNVIKFNEVYGMDQDSQDTGAVKWGDSDWNTFTNNRVHHSGDSFGQQHGMYVEDGSDHNDITNNIIYAIGTSPGNGSTSPINVKGIDNLVQNNVFDFTKSHAALRTHEMTSIAPARDNVVLLNIMYSTGSSSTMFDFQSYEDNRIKTSNKNIFYKTAGSALEFEGIPGADTYSNWKSLQGGKYDSLSITSNPQFVDAAARNYTLDPASPALTLGFQQIPQNTIGLKPDFVYPKTRGQWIFDGDVTDVTGNGNNGTLTGGSYVTNWAGTASSALSFNGSSDYVSVPDADPLDFGAPGTAFTVTAWVKTTASSIGGIVGKARATTTVNMDYRFRMLADGTVELSRFNQTAGVTEAVGSTGIVNDGGWHHVAFVNEGAGSHKLYLDGVLDTTSTTTWVHTNTNTDPVLIGRDRNGPSTNNYFNGAIDDVAVMNRALSAEEIQDLNHIPHQ